MRPEKCGPVSTPASGCSKGCVLSVHRRVKVTEYRAVSGIAGCDVSIAIVVEAVSPAGASAFLHAEMQTRESVATMARDRINLEAARVMDFSPLLSWLVATSRVISQGKSKDTVIARGHQDAI